MAGDPSGDAAPSRTGNHPGPAPLRHRLRVRYGECDAQGVVFNAPYLAWFDVAMTELWRAAFGSSGAAVGRRA